MRKPVYLGIDPGETSGWATLDAGGEVIAFGQFKMDNLTTDINNLLTDSIKHVVVEEYVNYGWKQQKRWSKNDTSKIIGKIETLCDLKGIPYTRQPANVKSIGYKWAGIGKAPTNHAISHQFDAVAHVVYWAQQNGIRPVGLAIPKEEK